MPLVIPPDYLNQIRRQAESDYPNETCGMLLAPQSDPDRISELIPCRNVQDEYHAKDPASFPRTARTAYFIEPQELLRIQRGCREKNAPIRVIYHSHVDAGDYFSEEDQRVALCDGEPAYPGVAYLVVSVRKGKAREASLYRWDTKEKSFFQEKI